MFHENWYSDNQIIDLINLVKKVKNLDGKVIEIGCWDDILVYLKMYKNI